MIGVCRTAWREPNISRKRIWEWRLWPVVAHVMEHLCHLWYIKYLPSIVVGHPKTYVPTWRIIPVSKWLVTVLRHKKAIWKGKNPSEGTKTNHDNQSCEKPTYPSVLGAHPPNPKVTSPKRPEKALRWSSKHQACHLWDPRLSFISIGTLNVLATAKDAESRERLLSRSVMVAWCVGTLPFF